MATVTDNPLRLPWTVEDFTILDCDRQVVARVKLTPQIAYILARCNASPLPQGFTSIDAAERVATLEVLVRRLASMMLDHEYAQDRKHTDIEACRAIAYDGDLLKAVRILAGSEERT